MRKLIQFVFLLLTVFIFSCRVTKQETNERKYYWEGKQVTKKEYDELLYKYTVEFVENYIKKQTPQK